MTYEEFNRYIRKKTLALHWIGLDMKILFFFLEKAKASGKDKPKPFFNGKGETIWEDNPKPFFASGTVGKAKPSRNDKSKKKKLHTLAMEKANHLGGQTKTFCHVKKKKYRLCQHFSFFFSNLLFIPPLHHIILAHHTCFWLSYLAIYFLYRESLVPPISMIMGHLRFKS